MSIFTPLRIGEADPIAAGGLKQYEGYPSYDAAATLLLPVLDRSAALLNLLLDDGTVDLELASAVVGLDPGLAFGTLQLANRDREDWKALIWELPLAVVAAGRARLQELLQRAPRITRPARTRNPLRSSDPVVNAVARASAARMLAKELGSCNPRKAFLSGLLFGLPDLARAASNSSNISHVTLLSAMCHTLPVGMVRAAMVGADFMDDEVSSDPLPAISLIAEALLQTPPGDSGGGATMERLANLRLWRSCGKTDIRQRRGLVEKSRDIASWSAGNLYRVDPWDFMDKLESQQ
jgi:hypothetical protein